MTNQLKQGDYVLATKYGDGDPTDHFCVGMFDKILIDNNGKQTDRYLVLDGQGKSFRAGGFRRCEQISRYIGDTIVMAIPWIGDKTGLSLWYWRYHPKQLKKLIDFLESFEIEKKYW